MRGSGLVPMCGAMEQIEIKHLATTAGHVPSNIVGIDGGGASKGEPGRGRVSIPSARRVELKQRGQTRLCGGCRACCVVFKIDEVKKDLNEPCRHLKPGPKGGCVIYDDRPQVCRSFECAWKLGLGSVGDRPDRLGILCYTVNLEDGGPGLAVVETKLGAFQQKRVRELLQRYEQRKPGRVILRQAEELRFRPASISIEGKPMNNKKAGPRGTQRAV